MSDLTQPFARMRGALIGLAAFSAVVNLLMLAGPLFMLQVYDRVLASGSSATLIVLFAIVAYLYAIMGIVDHLRGRILSRAGARLQDALEDRAFAATLRQAENPGLRARPSSALSDLGAIRAAVASSGAVALFDLPWSLAFIGLLFLFHPLLGWFAVAGAALVLVLSLLAEWRGRSAQALAARSADEADAMAELSRQAVETIGALGMTAHVARSWKAARRTSLDAALLASDRGGAMASALRTMRLLLQSAILGLGAYLVLRGELTAGAMIAGSILLGRALQPAEHATSAWPLFQRARQGWRDLSQLLQAMPATAKPMSLPRPAARLDVRDLALTPPGERVAVLQGVTFALEPGDAVAVIGPSASGKSSLARALTGLWSPIRGEIRLGDAELSQYGRDTLGALLGFLPQDTLLMPGSVAHNIARLTPEASPQAVVTAAQAAGAHEMILGLAEGYNTGVLAGGARLSGGQRQRIGLARALYGDPVLLVLDEPDAHLDEPGLHALNKAIAMAREADRIVVLMSHRPSALAACNKVLMLDRGRMIAFGPRDEVLARVTARRSPTVVPVPTRERA